MAYYVAVDGEVEAASGPGDYAGEGTLYRVKTDGDYLTVSHVEGWDVEFSLTVSGHVGHVNAVKAAEIALTALLTEG